MAQETVIVHAAGQHAVATQAFLIGGTLQIVVTNRQTHRVTTAITWRAVAIAGNRNANTFLGGITSESFGTMALFHMAEHKTFGILATSL